MNKNSKPTNIGTYLENLIQATLTNSKKKKLLKEDKAEDEKKLKSGEISVRDVVNKLNSIRSGRSLKDQEISNALEEYIDDLSKAEKTALFAYLHAISQIVVAQLPGDEVTDPSENPSNVEMEKKGGGGGKVTIKPIVVKKPTKGKEEEGEEKKKTSEDTTGPVPISPKK